LVCDRFKHALKHVAVLYEFSTLIEPEDVSASQRLSTRRLLKVPESPSATGQGRAAGGHHFSADPNVFIAFQEPSACFNTVDAI
jgi:hypothetical protein